VSDEAARFVAVGRVGRPHGLDGSFVVEGASEDPERFAVGARVYLEGAPAEVVSVKRAGGRLVVRLDRPAERGAVLAVPASELPELSEGEFYAFQLEGLLAVDQSGGELGRVLRVDPGVANDVLVLGSGLLLPLVEDCVRDIDLAAGRITIADGFVEADVASEEA
jgi:16S rRNA processing protein RimM